MALEWRDLLIKQVVQRHLLRIVQQDFLPFLAETQGSGDMSPDNGVPSL